MLNRLHTFFRVVSFCIGLCLAVLPSAWLKAQPSFFNFSYNGPSSLPVGPTCSSMLQGNIPDPIVSSKIGATITMSMFDAVAAGFQYNDLFTAGTTAHVFWFVKDNMGHSNTYEYFINFVDNSPPVFNLAGIFDTLKFNSIVAVPPAPVIPVTDNCTGIKNQSFNQSAVPDTCESGTFTRTWTATDFNFNTATFTQTIIIYKDSLPPVITGYPQNGSASCTQLATAYPAWLAAQIAVFSATDPSGIAYLTNNAPPVFPAGCKVPLTVRFKAVDNCQFQQNVFVTFSTSDNQGPVVVKPPKDTVAYCSLSDNELIKLREWISTKMYAQAFDSCSFPLTYTMKIGGVVKDSAQVVNAFLASFAGGCNTKIVGTKSYNKVHGFVSVDLFVKDACGNQTAMGNVDFGAIDTLPPVISGAGVTEQCGGGNDQLALQNWINAHGNATVIDDCSDFSWTNFSFTTSSGPSGSGNFNTGPYPNVQANNCSWFTDVTFRVTDDCGNSSTKKLRFSIVDTQAPVFTGLQPNITVFCPNPLPTVPAATISDNCDANVDVTFSRVFKDSLCAGSYTVLTTWTATDDCGNAATATQTIFVSDTTRPVFTLIPANKTFRCDTFVLPPVPIMGANIMATDNCSPVVGITTVTTSFQNPDPAVCGHYSYDIVRTFTASDECGNTRTSTQTISVIDNLGPAPGGVLDTTALCSALVPFPAPLPNATDACSGLTAPPDSIGQTITAGSCQDQYTITVLWVATDVCGNTTAFDQLVHVIDTVPPTLINIPANITVECDAIPALPNTNSFNASDNCNHPVFINLLETEIRDTNVTSCAHWTDYIIKREWTATDNCGNSRTYTQLIQIEDTTPPAILPPSSQIYPTDPDDCGANVMIPAPLSVTDICSGQLKNANLLKMQVMVASGPGSPFSTPVAPMSFQLAAVNTLPFEPVVASPTTELRVLLEKADAEGPTEFFNVFDENNNLLGTANTNSQCGDKTTVIPLTPNQLNAWLSDGTANFSLVPNGAGALACNLVCSPLISKATVQLLYTYSNTDVAIDLNYSLDNGPMLDFPPSGPTFLPTGTHTVIYAATDCAGNTATSAVQITVNDAQPPSLVAPANITAYTGLNNCESIVTLPFPAITENCAMSASLSLSSAILPLQFENDPDVGLVAGDIIPTLTGMIPNAVGPGILKIRHLGDNAQPGEFFNVYDEAGASLGSTAQDSIAGECTTFFETIIPVTAAQLNAWAAGGGNTSFYLESNRDLINFSNFVSNCAPLLPNATDGISKVQVVLEYNYAVVNYTIKKPVNQTVASGTLTGNSTTVTLPPANYTVTYTTADNAGLIGTTAFSLTVRDTVRPHALCQPSHIIQVNPSGVSAFNLTAATINNGSFDNCTPTPNLTYTVSPSVFNCSQAGSTVNVTLTVKDTSGNSATCHTLVLVTNTPPNPDYTPVCENGTLQLFANPPSASPFTYQWGGVNNYFSNQGNPVVTTNAMASNNGTYCVTITGATGCTSSSCEVVNLAILTATPVLGTSAFSICPGQNITLNTGTYNGANVKYQWLVDSMPALPGGPIVLDTTPTPVYNINNPPPGNYVYYVRVFANGCNTTFSDAIMVTVHSTPLADADPEQTLVCEGQSISLKSLTAPIGGLTYMWTGPNGFTSMLQNPSVTNNAVKILHQGKYVLITKRNGCLSIPDTVMVNINEKPAKPSISGNVNVCKGQTVNLVCSSLNGAQYLWTIPTAAGLFDTTTNSNTLQILQVSAANNGSCSVIVASAGCYSDASNPILLSVQDYPDVTVTSNAPICQDSLLKLAATFSSASPLTWVWTGPNSFINFSQNPIIVNGASGIYQVIGKTSYGCADTATINVTNVVAPSITFIGNNAPPCCDGTTDAMLSAVIVSDNPPLSYKWTGPPAFGTSTLPNPIIPDICTPYNGQYTLVVKDAFNCPSLPATTEINIQTPPITPMLQVNPLNGMKCAGDSMLLFFNNPTSGASYHWLLPNGDTITTTAPFLKITNAQPSQSGLYAVFAISSNGTCSSGNSNSVTVTIHPIPAIPGISSNSPVCEGAVLNLSSTVGVPNPKYHWTGPGGFQDTVLQNPVRQPVTLNMAGVYKLYISKNGCKSPETSISVEVVKTPDAPILAPAPTGICMNAPVSAFLNIVNPVNGMEYTWEVANSGIVLQGPSTATSLFLGLPNVLDLGPGKHTFRAIASTGVLPHCPSAYSSSVSISFDTIPAGVNAFAGSDRPACTKSPIPLMGAPNPLPGTVTGFWTQIGGTLVSIDNSNSSNASFLGTTGNVYTFQWSLSNGVCMNFSTDDVSITAQAPELAIAGPDIYSCSVTGIHLNATQGITTLGKWTQLGPQAAIGIVIDNPSNPTTTISGNLQRGQNYAFYWEIGNPGCGTESKTVRVYIFNGKPNAGSNQFVCNNENCTVLSASRLAGFESGKWTCLNNANVNIISPGNDTTSVCGLIPGKNIFVWTTNRDTCGNNSRDTVEVFYEIFPTAIDDAYNVAFGDTIHFNMLLNDLLPTTAPPLLKLISYPTSGTIADSLAKGYFVYRPQSGFTGSESMSYQICNKNCPNACSNGIITFLVGDAPECTIPTIITPNGDGYNDQFTIPSICTLGEGAEQLEVTIFNQWGDLVFHARPYRNDWEGTYNGQDLPAGTYFYVVRMSDSEAAKSSFLIIQR